MVSGLPRSGTSLMMQMLAAGGLELFYDDARKPDESNPRGYFEHRLTRGLPYDANWLSQCTGKVVKIISHLISYLPAVFHFDIIFMKRDLNEIIRSQNRMLQSLGSPVTDDEDELRRKYEKHLTEIIPWIQQQENMRLLTVTYQSVINDPKRESQRIANFLNTNLNISPMVQTVDTDLYRVRNNPQM